MREYFSLYFNAVLRFIFVPHVFCCFVGSVIYVERVGTIAESIVQAHPTSMGCLMSDDHELHEAATTLTNAICRRIRYLQGQELARKRKLQGDTGKAKKSKSDAFTKAQRFGLDYKRDLPTEYPQGETRLTQEAKQKVLESMNTQGQRNVEVIAKLMEETYVSIRIDINKKMKIESLVKRWPFIGLVSGDIYSQSLVYSFCYEVSSDFSFRSPFSVSSV